MKVVALDRASAKCWAVAKRRQGHRVPRRKRLGKGQIALPPDCRACCRPPVAPLGLDGETLYVVSKGRRIFWLQNCTNPQNVVPNSFPSAPCRDRLRNRAKTCANATRQSGFSGLTVGPRSILCSGKAKERRRITYNVIGSGCVLRLSPEDPLGLDRRRSELPRGGRCIRRSQTRNRQNRQSSYFPAGP